MRPCKLLLLLLITAVMPLAQCAGQTLLRARWQKVVCIEPTAMDAAMGLIHDRQGNSYVIGSFPHGYSTDCLGQILTDSGGTAFLVKQDMNGNKIFAKNLGATEVSNGDIRLCSNGDLVMGFTFTGPFRVDDSVLAVNQGSDRTVIILKVDSNLRLKWFRTFPASVRPNSDQVNWLYPMLLDANDNIYYSIEFDSSINVGNRLIIGKGGRYQTAIGKLSVNGDFLWVHHYYFDSLRDECYPGPMSLRSGANGSTDTLIFAGIGTDSLFIDSTRQIIQHTKRGSYFLSMLSGNGDIILNRFVDRDMSINYFCYSAEEPISRAIFLTQLSARGRHMCRKTAEACISPNFIAPVTCNNLRI
jgi:hypothetical protein